MASENVFDSTVASEGRNAAMEHKLLELWSRINEYLSPVAKSHLTDIMQQYEGLGDSEKRDFEESLKQQLTDRVTQVARNNYFSGIKSSALVVVCVATVFFLFVFFGYKLYKSLKEKQQKRDEKKKLRLQKKKK